jgi:hypothetical protein
MALSLFEQLGFSPTNIVTQTSAYTALITDDLININGSGVVVLSLPSLLSFQGTIWQKKMYAITNIGTTYAVTITPGKNGNTGVLDTINNGHSVWTVNPGETVVIVGFSNLTDWGIASPATLPVLLRNLFAITVTVASSASATPTNVFDANGAPDIIDITEVIVNATDAVSANICVLNGTSTVCTIAKGTVAQVLTPATTLATPVVAKGAVLAVFSSASGYGRVTIIGTTQKLISFPY